MLGEFQAQYLAENDPNAEKSLKHHERGIPAQKTYQAQVLKLADAMKALGNLFQRDAKELVNIATGDCASEEVVNALKSIERVGQNQYKNVVKTVIEYRTVSIHDIIKKNSLPLFEQAQAKNEVKAASKCTEQRLQPFQPFVHFHPASKRRSRRFFYARKPALTTISLRVWKAKTREEVNSLDMC